MPAETTTPAQPFPETIAELHRLVGVAHEQRVYLVQETGTGAWFARSTLDASAHHYLTGISCTCPAFLTDHACPHHALLLGCLGWLPDPPPCPACAGKGIARRGESTDEACACPAGRRFAQER